MIPIIEDWDFFFDNRELFLALVIPIIEDLLYLPTYLRITLSFYLLYIFGDHHYILSFHYTLGGGIYFSEKSTLNHFLFLPHLASNQWHRHPMVSYNKTQVWRQVLFYSFTYLFLVFVQRWSCSCVLLFFLQINKMCSTCLITEVSRKKNEFS